MKFTLKDYQAEAVDQLLNRLDEARSDLRTLGRRSSVSLCATTGAGKTVMSAAVIEALFDGSDEFEFDADDGAVVVWFSDDKALNEQTKIRLVQASDKLSYSDLITIEAPFDKPRLDPGKVYFLNTEKLSTTSRLTRGAREERDDAQGRLPGVPDGQAWTLWETINKTIQDQDRTLYLFIDEAHRGFGGKGASADKSTIVRRLVNGSNLVAPAPIVVGISATIGRFETAMSEADFQHGRRVLPSVNVDGARVQESGLLKDTVVLDFTTESGVFDRGLVKRAAEKLKRSAEAWAEYAKVQNDPHALVVPLLVLQLPNTPDPAQVGASLDAIAEVIPEITPSAIRHVLGQHTTQEFGSWIVDWVEPQLVQDRKSIRVLLAKEAISTGWDCPRAEVMVSFRTAREHTHITQILGRMVRNPLARRVPGDDRLNSVDCLLPYFDRTMAGKVVKFLTGQVTDVPGDSKRVLIDGRPMAVNPAFPADGEVWSAWRRVPTELLPQRGVRPVSRLLQFATELAYDGIRAGAVTEAETKTLGKLEACKLEFPDDYDATLREVRTVHGMSIAGTTGERKLTYTDFTMHSDDQAVAIAYRDARKAFSDIARAYVDCHAVSAEDDFVNPVRESMIEISALATNRAIRESVEVVANRLFDEWEHVHADAIAALSDLRRDRYAEIKAQAADPQSTTMIQPRSRTEDFQEEAPDGSFRSAPLVTRHLMSDDHGNFPVTRLNAWERRVVSNELARPGAVAWYRNPPRSAGDSLCICYRNELGNWRGMYPDFIFFERVNGRVMPSIIDPHRYDLDDALTKLKALASFAGKHTGAFHRIESVVEINQKPWALDLTREKVRKDVEYWQNDAGILDLYVKCGFERS